MTKKFLLAIALFLSLLVLAPKTYADEVDYKISRYDGLLEIQKDNTATFTQTITYDFDSSYNGQYVSLGHAGQMPREFSIDEKQVGAEVTKNNGSIFSPKTSLEKINDGYRLKIYNGGQDGDRVKVKVTWHLKHLLRLHQDIAELNWKPITDWDVPLHHVSFQVKAPQTKQTDLFAHLGYLQPKPTISKDEVGYKVSADYIGQGQPFELHAYWDVAGFTGAKDDQKKALASFQATEVRIKQKTKDYQKVFYFIIPLSLTLLLLLGFLIFTYYKWSIRPKKSGLKWLYEAPDDWSPQLVASIVYSTDWSEVNPTIAGSRGRLKFENMVQASLLDLIDRGNLEVEYFEGEPWLRHVHSEHLSSAERTFLEMAMGAHIGDKLAMADLFPAYRVDKKISVKNGYSVEEVNRYGRRMTSTFKRDLAELTRAVVEDKEALGLDDYYRPLSSGENGRRSLSFILLSLAMFSSFVSLVYAGSTGLLTSLNWLMILGYLALFLLTLAFIIAFSLVSWFDKQDGTPRKEVESDYQAWQAFHRMIKDIKRFDKAQLESIVVWNRILVYATLFGYAKQVEKVLRLYDIELPHQVNQYLNGNLFPYLYLSSQNFANFGHQAQAAQSFHVSSGGGFSGGGFSGGGGGGGGGAF